MDVTDSTFALGSYISSHGFVVVDKQIRSLPLTSLTNRSLVDGSMQILYPAFAAARTHLSEIREDAESIVKAPLPVTPAFFRRSTALYEAAWTCARDDLCQVLPAVFPNFCTDRGFVPKLLAFEEAPGGWTDIALEHIESACLIPYSPHLPSHGEGWITDLKSMVQTIHDNVTRLEPATGMPNRDVVKDPRRRSVEEDLQLQR
ncbi:hypothetical protein BJV74DRAFT_483642 [Russula compacta]|nr:hypothetical protein BJV74DRAFT_483642 [Russula compacta]